MSFVSFTFAAFFLVVLALRLVLDRLEKREHWIRVLVIASLVFYAWSVPWHVLLLLGLATFAYWSARVVAALGADAVDRRAVVRFTVGLLLAVLGLFKYWDYLALNALTMWEAAGFGKTTPAFLALALPLGISFYTFEAISYVVDVHRRRIEPTHRPRDLLLFIAFFPHLIAGPIVRAGDFLYQIHRRRRPRARVMAEGGYLVIRGLFMKVVVADNLAAVVDASWPAAAAKDGNGTLAVLATVLFAFQILCDFEGYSTIARGLAYLLGFRLPLNFDSPYIAGTFREFWQRWHITLSRWLRDYLYVPLGGNRLGRARSYVNLLLVMVLGGLWHGAANTFLAWGTLHGVALVVERALGLHHLSERGRLVPRLLWYVVVQTTVLAAWVFFRSVTTEQALELLGNAAFGPYVALDPSLPLAWIALFLLMPIAGHVRTLLGERFGVPDVRPMEKALLGALMFYAVCTAYGPSKTFIYFRF